jgi:16S rRNA (cytosine967-C5)-methyltransferase
MRYHSYLNSAKKIITAYAGKEPFSVFLKKYFSANKKYGSRDRKQIATLCYNFYRLGKALPGNSVEERIFTGIFLCEQSGNDFLNFHRPEWNELISKPLAEKISFAGLTIGNVFPWTGELSDGIDLPQFQLSFFEQPDLFLRIRPGHKSTVIKKLQDARLQFEMHDEDCIALPNATKLGAILDLDKEVVVQDHNSQRVLDFLKNPISGIQYPVSSDQHPVSVWDCCAASGGKSILALDFLDGKIELTVSDIRGSILSNLKKRFETAGIKNYKSFIEDLSTFNFQPSTFNFQLIICDAPCTGSGTWSRTPEQLCFFKEEMLSEFSDRQKKIVSNVIPQLQKDGLFIYITCSVFKKENEELVNYIKEKFHLQLLQMELLKGYDKKADTMFTAVFLNK